MKRDLSFHLYEKKSLSSSETHSAFLETRRLEYATKFLGYTTKTYKCVLSSNIVHFGRPRMSRELRSALSKEA